MILRYAFRYHQKRTAVVSVQEWRFEANGACRAASDSSLQDAHNEASEDTERTSTSHDTPDSR